MLLFDSDLLRSPGLASCWESNRAGCTVSKALVVWPHGPRWPVSAAMAAFRKHFMTCSENTAAHGWDEPEVDEACPARRTLTSGCGWAGV